MDAKDLLLNFFIYTLLTAVLILSGFAFVRSQELAHAEAVLKVMKARVSSDELKGDENTLSVKLEERKAEAAIIEKALSPGNQKSPAYRLDHHRNELVELHSQVVQNASLVEGQIAERSAKTKQLSSSWESTVQRLSTMREDYETSRKTFDDDIESATQSLEEEQEGRRAKLKTVLTEVETVEAKYDELQSNYNIVVEKLAGMKKEDAPDGIVMSSDIKGNSCVVNIGRRQGVTEGLRFEVYEQKRGGVRVLKGSIEAVDVYPTYARCKILASKLEMPTSPETGYEASGYREKYDPYIGTGETGIDAAALDEGSRQILVEGQDLFDPIVKGNLLVKLGFRPDQS